MKTNPLEDGSESLAHYGVKGMKWGVWNAETQRKYGGGLGRASNAMKAKLSSAGSAAAGGAKAVAGFSRKKMSAMGQKVNAMAANSKAKREYKDAQKKEIKEHRKELGMSKSRYDKLRERTLKSHDPRVVEKGMRTLTDDELNMKINRLQREEMISKMATSLTSRNAAERKAKSEALKANPLYKLGEDYTRKYLDNKMGSAKVNQALAAENDMLKQAFSKINNTSKKAAKNGSAKNQSGANLSSVYKSLGVSSTGQSTTTSVNSNLNQSNAGKGTQSKAPSNTSKVSYSKNTSTAWSAAKNKGVPDAWEWPASSSSSASSAKSGKSYVESVADMEVVRADSNHLLPPARKH